jgi:hypothetical protein
MEFVEFVPVFAMKSSAQRLAAMYASTAKATLSAVYKSHETAFNPSNVWNDRLFSHKKLDNYQSCDSPFRAETDSCHEDKNDRKDEGISK